MNTTAPGPYRRQPPAPLPAGTEMSLIPAGAPGIVAVATVRSWSEGPGAVISTARLGTTSAVAGALDGLWVWATGKSPEGELVVFEAAVTRVRPDLLTLTGVRRLACEARRAEVRAGMERRVEVSTTRSTFSGSTVDVSRSGCRARLAPAGLSEGQQVDLSLELDMGEPVRAHARVSRTTPGDDEVVLRFLEVSSDDTARLEWWVYTELSSSPTPA